ncbi:CB1 cannabinoid receptor-interacting protein 1, partial [Stegodyphus mimosarum]
MSQKQKKFSLTFILKRGDGNALIFYKQDGQRFDCSSTIKMKVQTPYKFILTFRPPQKIKTAILRGEELTVVEEEVTTDFSKYSLNWMSDNIPVTKKNSRSNFPLILELEDSGILELSLQFKFYGAEDKNHSAWGKCLHQIEYDCCYKAENSFVEIIKESYR